MSQNNPGPIDEGAANVRADRNHAGHVEQDAHVDLSKLNLPNRDAFLAKDAAPLTTNQKAIDDDETGRFVFGVGLHKGEKVLSQTLKEGQAKTASPSGGIWYRGVRFASRPEVACTEMMKRYIKGYEVIEHHTFQIPIYDFEKGTSRFIDFGFDKTLIEYHPPRFWRQGKRYGDFKDANEYFTYRRELESKVDPADKRAFKEKVKNMLTARYHDERRALMDDSHQHRTSELIVVTDAKEFYAQVIVRFAENPPSRERFMKEYRAIEDRVKKITQDSKLLEKERRYKRDLP